MGEGTEIETVHLFTEGKDYSCRFYVDDIRMEESSI